MDTRAKRKSRLEIKEIKNRTSYLFRYTIQTLSGLLIWSRSISFREYTATTTMATGRERSQMNREQISVCRIPLYVDGGADNLL